MRERSTAFAQTVVVRLFRIWSASRAAAIADLPRMAAVSDPFGLPPETGEVAANLFELIEMHLGRALVPECCCSQELSNDERALAGVIAVALRRRDIVRAGPTAMSDAITLAARRFSDAIACGLRGPAIAGAAQTERIL